MPIAVKKLNPPLHNNTIIVQRSFVFSQNSKAPKLLVTKNNDCKYVILFIYHTTYVKQSINK